MNDSNELQKKVEAALAEVRPYLEADGGGVQLVGIDEAAKIVKVRLTGGCACCPSAGMTLKNGVEAAIRKNAPEIKSVVAV
ncbi:MAG: NifU family protein [Elusimicrobiales bacterium]|nr:NifU family protein [Elusimicrobiales bacterium]